MEKTFKTLDEAKDMAASMHEKLADTICSPHNPTKFTFSGVDIGGHKNFRVAIYQDGKLIQFLNDDHEHLMRKFLQLQS